MTYFGFLLRFIGIPLVILAGLTWWDARRGRRLPPELRGLPAWPVLLAHVAAAVIWTTPWDNYLVATGVWYYDPRLVTGVTLGWVPIEEYTFFVVQTLMTGLWLLWLARREPGTRDGGLEAGSQESGARGQKTIVGRPPFARRAPICLRPRRPEASGWRASCLRFWGGGRETIWRWR